MSSKSSSAEHEPTKLLGSGQHNAEPDFGKIRPMIHPSIEPLAFLVGKWSGEGVGEYPTVRPFTYGEETVFTHTGKPYLIYSQRTWNLETGQAMHEESGYWRLCGPSPNHVEAMIVHAFGVAEVAEGMIEGTHVELVSTSVSMTSTAKSVSALGRSLAVDGDMLHYRLRMSAVGLPAHHHLCADLQRTTLGG